MVCSYHASAVVLDAPHPARTSSTTVPFDWKLAQKAASELNVILAGGLNADNVVQAIEIVRPYAVDVSGGVESRPGKKDHEKLVIFIQRIRAWDSRTNAGISESSADDLFLKH
jgi:phosphoribosylanthranilate isomerase